MGMNVSKLLADLERMTGTELRRRYAEAFGEESRSGNQQWLIRRIAWRMQALEEGGLPVRARQVVVVCRSSLVSGARSAVWAMGRSADARVRGADSIMSPCAADMP
jgi:hypothetical protein